MDLSLTLQAAYGVRVTLYLAQLNDDKTMTSAALGEACEIPQGNIPTVISILSRAGILSCRRGAGGGCKLAREAARITILEVIRAFEGPLEAPQCILDNRRCHEKDRLCAIHDVWTEARNGVLSALEGVSVLEAAIREVEILDALQRPNFPST